MRVVRIAGSPTSLILTEKKLSAIVRDKSHDLVSLHFEFSSYFKITFSLPKLINTLLRFKIKVHLILVYTTSLLLRESGRLLIL